MADSETENTTDFRDDPEVILQTAGLSEMEQGHVSPIPVLPQLSVALGLLVIVFGVTYIGTATHSFNKAEKFDVHVEAVPAQQALTNTNRANAFANTELRATSAIVWDVKEQRVLFNKDADTQRPLASITKLMTALVSYELLDSDDKVSISKTAISVEGDSGLTEGERFTVENLVNLTLIESSNDGAVALGARAGNSIDATADPDAIFVQAMNVKAEELGLTKTYFKNSTGLDISETKAGAYGSARDVAMLMEYVITHITDAVALTTLDVANVDNLNGEYHTAKNTNPRTGEFDGLIASKTGYTTLSGGNLVVAINVGLNHPIVVVVLGSSFDGRFDDAIELVKRAKEHIVNTSQ